MVEAKQLFLRCSVGEKYSRLHCLPKKNHARWQGKFFNQGFSCKVRFSGQVTLMCTQEVQSWESASSCPLCLLLHPYQFSWVHRGKTLSHFNKNIHNNIWPKILTHPLVNNFNWISQTYKAALIWFLSVSHQTTPSCLRSELLGPGWKRFMHRFRLRFKPSFHFEHSPCFKEVHRPLCTRVPR